MARSKGTGTVLSFLLPHLISYKKKKNMPPPLEITGSLEFNFMSYYSESSCLIIKNNLNKILIFQGHTTNKHRNGQNENNSLFW
jgi:hypothetical protein